MIEFTDVVKSYSVGNKALNGVTMQIEDGEFAFLVGPSGSGKSTIIKLQPTSGSVHVNGYSLERIRKREIPYLRRTVGVVFQDFRLIPNMTVYDNVAFAMRVIGAREKEIRERVPYVLELVGLENKAKRKPTEMSGGEEINNLGTTVLVVTHERDLVERFGKRVIAIDDGVVISDGMDGYYGYEDQ